MQEHLNKYIEDNRDDVEDVLRGILHTRGMTLTECIDMMKNNSSCGYEATLLVLCHMFKMKILVICSDYLWVSEKVALADCNVVLIQNAAGLFYRTKCKKKFHVGDVPKIESPKLRKNIKISNVQCTPKSDNPTHMKDTSTPKNVSGKQMFTFKLSPIETRKNDGHDEQATTEVEVKTKRLGMGAPVQKIRKDKTSHSPSVNVRDIAALMGGSSSVTLHTIEKKEVKVCSMCTLCKKIFFTINGYDYHIFSEHHTRNREDNPPEMIQGHDISITSSGESSDVSSLPNIIGPSQRIELKHKTLTYMISDPEEKNFKCQWCTEWFYYEKSLQTHFHHAHRSEEDQSKKYPEEAESVRETVNGIEHIKTDDPKTNIKKGRSPKENRKQKNVTILSDQKIQPEPSGTTFRQTHLQSKVLVALTEQKERENKEKLALESSIEMTKEDYVKVYSLWPRTSQISVEGKKKIQDADKKIDVPEHDGNDEPENTDTLVGENADGIDEDTNEDNPVIESEILQNIEEDNSGEIKPHDTNIMSSGGISSENTGPEKSHETETGISSENTDKGKKDQKETPVIDEQSKFDIQVEKQKEDNADSSKVESDEKDNMAKDPHFDLNKTDNPSEDSKSPSDKDESTIEPIIKWKPNKKKNKQSVHNPTKENDDNESKGTGKPKSKKKDSSMVQAKSEV